jgi:hypothetical protein
MLALALAALGCYRCRRSSCSRRTVRRTAAYVQPFKCAFSCVVMMNSPANNGVSAHRFLVLGGIECAAGRND